jgi:hypothetical protein
MSAGEQVDIVTSSSRQPSRLAKPSTAGNHDNAWLSPKSATVVGEVGFPYTQEAFDGEPFSGTWQPSR